MKQENINLLKGNHEQMILPVLNELINNDKEKYKEIIDADIQNGDIGQYKILLEFCNQSGDEQIAINEYIKSRPLYSKITIKNRSCILVHAGIPDYNEFLPMEYYTEEELLFGKHDYTAKSKETFFIIGHTLTHIIEGAEPDKIFRYLNIINIDCGLGYGGRLGALCLETFEKIYI